MSTKTYGLVLLAENAESGAYLFPKASKTLVTTTPTFSPTSGNIIKFRKFADLTSEASAFSSQDFTVNWELLLVSGDEVIIVGSGTTSAVVDPWKEISIDLPSLSGHSQKSLVLTMVINDASPVVSFKLFIPISVS